MCPNRALYEVTTLTAIRYFCGPCMILLLSLDNQLTGDTNGRLPSDA